ncbi:MAG: L-seryl-tRNA(Sec) selenium transferase [bacterium]
MPSHPPFKNIPSVEELLSHPELLIFSKAPIRNLIINWMRRSLKNIRVEIENNSAHLERDEIKAKIIFEITEKLKQLKSTRVSRVINATGIVLHTNLGRAPLGLDILKMLEPVFSGYSSIEYDIDTGKRGKRQDLLADLLTIICGCEDALVVNNNAAAVLLILNSLARRREVIISRGELVEIGGSFRIPEIMKLSGTRLLEVGTTNRTKLKDYENAIGPGTGLILSVHTSNFCMKGFTQQVPLINLAGVCKKHYLPLVRDLGSGALLKIPGIDEITVEDTIKQGADLVCFSGDKLTGGPQSGIIAGKRDWVKKLKRNPLFRAVRTDKITYSILENLLKTYLFQHDYCELIPTLSIISRTMDNLRKSGNSIIKSIKKHKQLNLELVATDSYCGGGSQPDRVIPSLGLFITHSRYSPQTMAKKLRQNTPPIIGRIHKDRYILDLRTVLPAEIQAIVHAINGL